MKHISSRSHGVLDYAVGVFLLVAPFLFGFADNEPARNAAWIVGAATLIYSLFTAYELGLVRLIPYRVHLGLDILGGIFLAASPWLMDFADYITWPHVTFGILEIGAVLMSRPTGAAADDHHIPHAPMAARH